MATEFKQQERRYFKAPDPAGNTGVGRFVRPGWGFSGNTAAGTWNNGCGDCEIHPLTVKCIGCDRYKNET